MAVAVPELRGEETPVTFRHDHWWLDPYSTPLEQRLVGGHHIVGLQKISVMEWPGSASSCSPMVESGQDESVAPPVTPSRVALSDSLSGFTDSDRSAGGSKDSEFCPTRRPDAVPVRRGHLLSWIVVPLLSPSGSWLAELS